MLILPLEVSVAMKDTLTFRLDGEVTIEDFAQSLSRFERLVHALSSKVAAHDRLQWVVHELSSGSALTTFRGLGDPQAVCLVVDSYEQVGDALEHKRTPELGKRVENHALKLLGVLNGKVTSIQFETEERTAIVKHHPAPAGFLDELEPVGKLESYGAVEGKVQTLSSRGELRFILYDLLFDKPVSCYVQSGYEDVMRDIWGKMAIVAGRVTRDGETGRPVAIRGVTEIQVVEEVRPGDYKRLQGILRVEDDEELPEVVLRRLRDA